MRIYDFKKMVGGWFVGNFKPSSLRTKKFEVSYKIHKKKEKWDHHYHKKATEINLVIKGKMKIRGRIIKKNQIFVLQPKEIADPIFYEDTHIVCIKAPSVIGDKYIVK
tara:strand:- start:3368 stop:3691 length:324 start_codon:yes stop_codon:yes gene_type:complete